MLTNDNNGPAQSLGQRSVVPPLWTFFLFVTLLWAALFAVRLAGLPDLMDGDQERPASYVLDAAVNGHWIVQRDVSGAVTSKPPLYTWLAALATVAVGRASRLALYLPCGLAELGVAWLLLAFGSARLGRWVGFWAAVMFLLSPLTLKQIALARPTRCSLPRLPAPRCWPIGPGRAATAGPGTGWPQPPLP